MRTQAYVLGLAVLLLSAGCSGGRPQAPVEGPRVEAGAVPSADGVMIAYESHGSGDPALVFIHGWCCDRTYWRHQVRVFEDRYRVVLLDLAGHGQSGAERSEWTAERFAQDVEAVADQLGLSSMILIGHSMGGTVAVEAAARMSDRVIGIIGVDTLQNVEMKYEEEKFQQFMKPLEENFREGTLAFVSKGLFPQDADPALVKQVSEDMAQGPARVGIGCMRGLFNHDLTGILDTMTIPVRLINSDMFPTDEAANRRHIHDFQLIRMTGVGHFPMLEAPDRFNARLAAVVAALAGEEKELRE